MERWTYIHTSKKLKYNFFKNLNTHSKSFTFTLHIFLYYEVQHGSLLPNSPIMLISLSTPPLLCYVKNYPPPPPHSLFH